MGSSKKDLLALPDDVVDAFGYGLHLAQIGLKHPDAKSLSGFGSAGVLEIVEELIRERLKKAEAMARE